MCVCFFFLTQNCRQIKFHAGEDTTMTSNGFRIKTCSSTSDSGDVFKSVVGKCSARELNLLGLRIKLIAHAR